MESKSVLYADDDENDAFLLERAFKQVGIVQSLQVVTDGQQAIDFLAGIGQCPGRQTPGLLLLDLNMPLKSGFDVLTWLRKQPAFSTLPVVVLTSSRQDRDIHTAYSLGANAYLVKPPGTEKLLDMAKSLKDFWLTQNQCPPDCAAFKAIPVRSEAR
jgi:CheY-like chemotaxis protein